MTGLKIAKFKITGGRALDGQVKISGAKNAALPILLSTILTDEKVCLKNVPDLADVKTSFKLLEDLGKKCFYDADKGEAVIEKGVTSHVASYELVKTMRASIMALGPLVAYAGSAEVSLPGGCPATGTLTHCRGNTVDVTLVNQAGEELEMPSGFDEFTTKADRNYEDCSDFAADNAEVLRTVLEKHGFTSIASEWWHFVDKVDYPVEAKFMPCEPALYYADCQSHINLRLKPDSNATSIQRILKDEQFLVLGYEKSFALVEYNGMIGYVHPGYIRKV